MWLGHHFQGQRSRSPGRFTHRGLNAWGRRSGDRENVLGVGNCCYVAPARRRARPLGAHGGRRGAGAYCVATRTACLFRPQRSSTHTGIKVKVKVHTLDIALFVVNHHCRSAQVWHVFSRDFAVFTCTPTR